MVKKLIIEQVNKAKKAVPRIEEKLKVHISMNKNNFTIKGKKEYDEFIADNILRSVDFGFDIEDALLLLDENFVLEFIDIKEHTRRNNLKDVRARVIGRKGKAMKTIENLTGSVLFLRDNTLGLIVEADNLDVTVQSIESIIQGSKHGNAFSYLEKNKAGNEFRAPEDLGLTERAKKLANE
jgi:ribosomal RNA assembly protein